MVVIRGGQVQTETTKTRPVVIQPRGPPKNHQCASGVKYQKFHHKHSSYEAPVGSCTATNRPTTKQTCFKKSSARAPCRRHGRAEDFLKGHFRLIYNRSYPAVNREKTTSDMLIGQTTWSKGISGVKPKSRQDEQLITPHPHCWAT